jgi:hypothetical protein
LGYRHIAQTWRRLFEVRIGGWRAAPRRLAALLSSAWPRRKLVTEACLSLLAAEARLRLVPLKRQGLADMSPAADPALDEAMARASEPERQAARDVGWAVSRAAVYLPFPARCLAQALAARAMLRRRGIGSLMRVGVGRPGSESFEAHAWLEAAAVEVTGYPVPAQLRVIGCLYSDGGRSG